MDYNSIIDQAAEKASTKILESILRLKEFYAGDPKMLKQMNRDIYKTLTPASEMLLKAKYGEEFVELWKQQMSLGGKGQSNGI